ncbi:7956_t:CDS:2 [Gigaspora margarita]|uniref:7956_t:CDS:1 n=1 Tax=Gigaspora margarita TaxID=4874 RepID=A0ABN7UAS2_GIGMA|nr:7956_t:CDS:2 [Gigaspora margarita]
MKNEIPHLTPFEKAGSKRYFTNHKGTKSISDTEREFFECSEIKNFGQSVVRCQIFLHKTYETYKIITQIMDTKRGKLFHIMAQLFFIIQNEPEKFNARPKIIEEYLRNTREIPINFQETIKRIFDTLKLLIEINLDIFHKKHRLSPIEFVFISWIIAKNQKYSLIQYQECLLKMKEYVREHHEDTRTDYYSSEEIVIITLQKKKNVEFPYQIVSTNIELKITVRSGVSYIT